MLEMILFSGSLICLWWGNSGKTKTTWPRQCLPSSQTAVGGKSCAPSCTCLFRLCSLQYKSLSCFSSKECFEWIHFKWAPYSVSVEDSLLLDFSLLMRVCEQIKGSENFPKMSHLCLHLTCLKLICLWSSFAVYLPSWSQVQATGLFALDPTCNKYS